MKALIKVSLELTLAIIFLFPLNVISAEYVESNESVSDMTEAPIQSDIKIPDLESSVSILRDSAENVSPLDAIISSEIPLLEANTGAESSTDNNTKDASSKATSQIGQNAKNNVPKLSLDPCRLPSAQGWNYWWLGTYAPENRVFSVQDCVLLQNSLGVGYAGQGGNLYRYPDVIDPDQPFALEVRARVLETEIYSGYPYVNHWGFGFAAFTGSEYFGIGLGINEIQDVNNNVIVTGINNREFHTYRLECTPGEGYDLYIDGNKVASGESRTYAWPNMIILGDSTGGPNAKAEITSMDFFQPLNNPPDSSNAKPSRDIIWPPNHNWVPIDIMGITDPEGDPIAISVDGIYQDEPVDIDGDGKFMPDGMGIGTSTAQIRAERSGFGNGRVYHIDFTAIDGRGGQSKGEVLVKVPHDNKEPAVDDGSLYDSSRELPYLI